MVRGMKIEQAIQKAIERGWLKDFDPKWMPKMEQVSLRYRDWLDWVTIQKALLDPLFWQALGKAMGWGKYCDCLPIGHEHKLHCEMSEWFQEWHRLIDALAGGKSIEEYFDTLTP